MMRLLSAAGLRLSAVLFLTLALVSASPVGAQERFGGLAGKVTDSSNAAVPGATVTAVNRETNAGRSTVTTSDGSYRIADLTPGRYDVKVELSGFQAVSVENVLVLLGRTFNVDAQLQVGAVTETVNVTADVEKQIDLKSVTIAHNVTSEELDLLPKTRNFTDIALTSPSVNRGEIEGGLQVNGASGAENSFTVDGVVTNSLINGRSRQNTVFEYVQEVQVKTGGIDAEYGGALGGVISAVTKSGGNTFHGEAHYYYDGNGMSAGPVERLQLDPVTEASAIYVQDAKQKNNRNELGGSVGGPLVQNKLFFFASYSPQIVRRTNDYGFASGTDPGSINLDQLNTQLFGKLTYQNSRLQANGSVLYTPTRTTGTLPSYNGLTGNSISSSQAGNAVNLNRGFKTDQTNVSGNVDLWLTGAAYLSLRGGYFYDNYADTGIPDTTSVIWNASSVGVAGVPAALQQPLNYQNVPRAQITAFDKTKRGNFEADYIHSFDAAGTHSFKGGFGYQRTTNDVNSYYPGGYVLLDWGKSFTSSVTGLTGTGTYGYYEVNDRGVQGLAGANIISLFVQDAWSPTPRLTMNLGIRTENETVPSFRPDIKADAFHFTFGDKLAPRLGATYDLNGDGRIKLYGSWGRYYDWTKYELSRGSFGADTWRVYYRALDTLDVYGLNLDNKPGADLWGSASGFRDRRVPNFETVDPLIKPMYQDSTNAGVEWQATPTTVVGLHYVHNNLGRTIEDLGAIVNGDEVYYIANPGEGGALITPHSGATTDFPTPKAKRKYDALEMTASRRFSRNWFASGSVTISRLWGNYAGLANSDEILTPTTGVSSSTAQQQSGSISRPGGNVNRAWDIDEVLWDSHGNLDVTGRLATDRPVVAKLYGAYTLPVEHADWRVSLCGQRHAADDVREYAQPDPGVGGRPRRHGPDAVPDPHRPARLARAAAGGGPEAATRAQHPEPVQPEDRAAQVQQSEPRGRSGARLVGDRPQQGGSGSGLRLQRPDSRITRRVVRL